MHACGHDMHTASLMAAATFLHAAKTTWKRTLVCLFQPDEETAGGAQPMVDDDLYYNQKRGIPILDVLHAQHDIALKAGAVASAKVPFSQRLTPSKSPSLAKWPYISSGPVCRPYRNCQSYHRTTTNAHHQRSKTRGICCHRLRKHPRRKCFKHYSRLC